MAATRSRRRSRWGKGRTGGREEGGKRGRKIDGGPGVAVIFSTRDTWLRGDRHVK